jgi:NADPH2:quinone reductase
MRAWRFHEFGPIENLKLEEADLPTTAPGEVVVRVSYASLNPADRYMVMGKYPRPAPRPFSVGRDCSGIVSQAAPGGRFKEGDPVILLRSDVGVSRTGTLAEYVAIPEESLAPVPAGWSMQEGAAAPLVYLTAWRGLVDLGQIQPGQTVLVTGASGGVGSAAVMLAKALGARVVAQSRSAEKGAWLKSLGADAIVGADPATFAEEVKAALQGGRVDLVIENLGGPWVQHCVNVCGVGGKIMVIGLLTGLSSEITLGLLIFKQITIRGMNVGEATAEESQRSWEKLVDTLNRAGARPAVDGVYPMDQVQEAFAHLAKGPKGKVIIDIGGSAAGAGS